jgi:transglutaminase-like putative cysteine protease
MVAILLILLLMLVPYLPALQPTTSKQAEIDKSPPDFLKEDTDTDGDLLSDSDELYVTETDYSDSDTDNDGLLDGKEYEYWTDRFDELDGDDSEVPDWIEDKYPYLTEKERRGLFLADGDLDSDGQTNIRDKDSDNDDLPDGFEVHYGLDPGDPTSNMTDLPENIRDHVLINRIEGSELLDFYDDLNLNNPDFGSFDDGDYQNILFRVTPAAYPRYWRNSVFDVYQNGFWRTSWQLDPNLLYDGSVLGNDVEKYKNKYDITYKISFDGYAKGVLPAPLNTMNLYSITPESSVYYNPEGVFSVNQYIKSYKFNATYFQFDFETLKSAMSPSDLNNDNLISVYNLPKLISEVAYELTADLDSDFQKASAIAGYLRTNFIYDLNSYEYNLNYPNSSTKFRFYSSHEKVLINILDQTHRGHCVDFATLFVQMCRINDIPARFATGFAPGELDEKNLDTRVVRVGHAHAWAEVLFEDIGWIPFEVTPSVAIYGNTTGVGVAGMDENVIAYNDLFNETTKDPDISGGSGPGDSGNSKEELLKLINHPRLDHDNDGILNIDDTDDDNDDLTDDEEIELGTNPFDKDTDNDGLTDFEEVREYGTSPKNADTDSDALTDYTELRVTATNPLLFDTDGGGAYDGLEVKKNGNPKDPKDDTKFIDSDNDGLFDSEEEELGTDPYNADTDGGGANDKLEQLADLDPVNDPLDDLKVLDSDMDGLMDSKELELGTNRYMADSDYGGVNDGREFLNKFDPLNSSDDFLQKDNDGDGLTNGFEMNLGTDMNNSDSDFGGVNDGIEVRFGFDPLNDYDDSQIDSDGDKLSNIEEGWLGTNPLKVDTDNDNLPDGWIDSNNNHIKDLGEYEDRDLDGYRDHGLWNNGAGPGETNPVNADTDNDKLFDGLEIELGTNPLDWDTDDDGLSDWEEVLFLTDPHNFDTDGDGLNDGLEVWDYNSNPTLLDTDGDGLNDQLELEYGTDPYSVDSDMDGVWDFDEFNGGTPSSDSGSGGFINPDPRVIPPNPGDPGYTPNPPDYTDPPNGGDPVTGGASGGTGGNLGSNLGNVWPIIIGLILIIIISLYYMIWRGQHIEELAEVAEEAEERLLSIEDEHEFDSIRLAIFDAYKSMLKIMQRYDFVREPSMTPKEFKIVIINSLPIGEKNIDRLTTLFEEARYSDHKLNIQTRDKAIESFRGLKSELRGLTFWRKQNTNNQEAEATSVVN